MSEGGAEVWRGVFAVVYTFNRKDIVAQCLASLKGQRVAPERIVLVDNGSVDGTERHLAELGYLADPALTFVRLEQNAGAAGGLAAGIGRAYADGCAWAWVMDDDVICEPEALAELKRAFEENFTDASQPGFLVSQLVDARGGANNVPQVDERLPQSDASPLWAEHLAKGLVRVRISTLTSILLPRATIAHCGAPLRDFFIWGEDTDYTLRITNWRPGYLVGRSRVVHLRGVGGFLDVFNESVPARLRNFYYLYRNTTYLRFRYWPAHGAALFLGKAALHFCRALTGPEHRLLRARVILFGTIAGLFFRPREERLEGAPPVAVPFAAASEKEVCG
jgi:dTDP-4-dehydrorhamnose reductase